MDVEYSIKNKQVSINAKATILIVGLVLFTLVIVLPDNNDYNESNHTTEVNSNKTLCSFIKMFPVTDNLKVTVCVLKKHLMIDIRYFIRNNPTLRGIFFDVKQWNELVKVLPAIEKTLKTV